MNLRHLASLITENKQMNNGCDALILWGYKMILRQKDNQVQGQYLLIQFIEVHIFAYDLSCVMD